MKQQTVAARAPQFQIPVELLKSFRNEVRTIPQVLPANGWIIFDRAMLTSILRDGDAKARADLAKNLDEYGEGRGILVMMESPAR